MSARTARYRATLHTAVPLVATAGDTHGSQSQLGCLSEHPRPVKTDNYIDIKRIFFYTPVFSCYISWTGRIPGVKKIGEKNGRAWKKIRITTRLFGKTVELDEHGRLPMRDL